MYAWWVTLEAQGAKNLMGALDTNGYHYPFDQETERQVKCDTQTEQRNQQQQRAARRQAMRDA